MNTEEITIRVDAETAAAYRAADEKLKAIVAMKVHRVVASAKLPKPSFLERWDAITNEIDQRLTQAQKDELIREVEALS